MKLSRWKAQVGNLRQFGPTDAPPILELNPIFNMFKIAGELVTKIKNIYDEPKEQEESAEQEEQNK